jgi:hypothetical protein
VDKEDRIQTVGQIARQVPGDWAQVPILIDCGVEINTIDEKLALSYELEELKGAALLTVLLPDSSLAVCFYAYWAQLKARDDWGVERQFTVTLYGICDSAQPVILGLLGLKEARIVVDCEAKRWRYKIDSLIMKMEDPISFDKLLENEPQVYAVMVGSMSTLLAAPTALPKELQDYEDVASSDAANALLEHHGGDYAIELEEGATALYGLLYNLSPKELEILREYIATAKRLGWIWDSTSPAGAPVLFVPKKDGTLRLCVDY